MEKMEKKGENGKKTIKTNNKKGIICNFKPLTNERLKILSVRLGIWSMVGLICRKIEKTSETNDVSIEMGCYVLRHQI